MKIILISIFLLSTIANASVPPKQIPTSTPSQSDINNDVSAMIDAQNQQAALQQQQAIQANNNQSDGYSNCPNCVH